jgi:transcriptional regulator with XRE-family HTH domain
MELITYLKKHKMTHKEFSKKVGVSDVQITRIVNKTTNPSAHLIREIEKATKGEVTFNDLFNPELPSRLNKKRKKVK